MVFTRIGGIQVATVSRDGSTRLNLAFGRALGGAGLVSHAAALCGFCIPA